MAATHVFFEYTLPYLSVKDVSNLQCVHSSYKNVPIGEHREPEFDADDTMECIGDDVKESLLEDRYEFLKLVKVAIKHENLVLLEKLLDYKGHMGSGYSTFISACESGNLRVVQWVSDKLELYHHGSLYFSDYSTIYDGFDEACAQGHLHLVVWFMREFYTNLLSGDVERVDGYLCRFSCACKHGQLHVAKWLATTFGITRNEVRGNTCSSLDDACESGQLHVVKWLIETFHLTVDDITYKADDDYDLFDIACREGHLHVARWLGVKFEFCTDTDDVTDAFELACISGQLHVLSWLSSTFDVITKDCARQMVCTACDYGKLQVVKWLKREFNLTACDIQGGKLFRDACTSTRLKLAFWLRDEFNLTESDIFPPGHSAALLIHNMIEGHFWRDDDAVVDVFQWLKSTYKLTIEDFKYSFDDACASGRFVIAKWMYHVYGPLIACNVSEYTYLKAFPRACARPKNLSWLVRVFHLNTVNAYKPIMEQFLVACQEGNVGLLRLLTDTFNITVDDVRKHNCRMLRVAAEHKRLRVVKWLVGHFHLSTLDIRVLRDSEKYANNIRQWYTRGPDIHKWLSKAFGQDYLK